MTKNEKQQLETISRYLKDGFVCLDSGRIQHGKDSVEKAEILVDVLLALADRKKK